VPPVLHDPANLANVFAAIVGEANLRPPLGAEARCANLIATPSAANEIAEIVRKCEADRITIAPLGSARTLAEIRRAPAAIGISLARMKRITAYEPDDMTVVAEAGATLAELNAAMDARGQWLPADPPRPELTALGALVAAARFGPSRLSEGSVRDLLIGVRFAGHGGRLVHGGGRVVKNVAGYDLMKVMTGSFGTLGIITETTFRVRPLPARRLIATMRSGDAASSFRAARTLHDAVALAHLEVASPSVAAALGLGAEFTLIAGFGGSPVEADHLQSRIPEILGPNCAIASGAEADALYQRLRDFDFSASSAELLAATPPAELAALLSDVPGGFLAFAGSGVARIFLDARDASDLDRTVGALRTRARDARGHVRVVRVLPEFRGGLEIFDQPATPAMNLMRRMKATFDPRGVFNSGCFVGGL
jgi:glycolate oxidase FAD binding subunit